jgi:sialidase-1
MAYRGLLDLRSWDVPRGIITVNNPPATMPRVTLLLGLTLCRAATPEHDDPGKQPLTLDHGRRENSTHLQLKTDDAVEAARARYGREAVSVFPAGAIPSLTFIPAADGKGNGTMLAFSQFAGPRYGKPTTPGCSSAVAHACDLGLRRSTDLGSSWSNATFPALEATGKVASWCCPQSVWGRHTQTVVLQFSNDTRTPKANNGCDIGEEIIGGVLQVKSSDRGRTWSQYLDVQDQIKFPRVASGGDYRNSDCLAPTSGQGLVMRPVNGKFGGRLVFCTNGNAYQGDVPVFSDDGGRTYNYSKDLYVPGLDECSIAQAANGSLVLIARNCENSDYLTCGMLGSSVGASSSGNHRFVYSISNDGGEHWTPPRNQTQLVTPVCQGSIISYQGRTDSAPRLYVTSPYSDLGRFNGTVLASDDDGATFSRSLQLWPGKPHQPGMGGGFGYTGLACGLPGEDFDCAVLFDQDEPGLWLLTFDSSHVKTDDLEAHRDRDAEDGQLLVDRLTRLHDLHQVGGLTAEEFALSKRRLLEMTSSRAAPNATSEACEPAFTEKSFPHSSALIMPFGAGGVACYTIPSIVGPFPPHSNAVLVFAEAREEAACPDSGKHALVMARSSDGGSSFGSIRFLYNDSEATKDGLNLGASVYDATTKTVHVLTNECADEYGEPPCGPTASLLQFSSTSFGETWQPPRNITADMVAGGFAMLNPGPGTGIQLAKTGRLLVPAWGPRIGHGFAAGSSGRNETDWNAVALISDDSGVTWKVSATVPARKQGPGSRPNELQAAELSDGTIVLNARDEISLYRLISRSSDGGETWAPFSLSGQLSSAMCQGSTIAIGSTLFFSHPFAWTRNNGWIKYSVDAGESWWLWRRVDGGEFGYSAATVLNSSATHATIGLAYSGAGGVRFTAVTNFLPKSAQKTDDDGSSVREVNSTRQLVLFLDDTQLSEVKGDIALQLNRPVKHEQPVLTPTEPWESWAILFYNTVLFVAEGDVRLYYSCAAQGPCPAGENCDDLVTGYWHTCLAISRDKGRTFRKPSLGVAIFNGSKQNVSVMWFFCMCVVTVSLIRNVRRTSFGRRTLRAMLTDGSSAATAIMRQARYSSTTPRTLSHTSASKWCPPVPLMASRASGSVPRPTASMAGVKYRQNPS